MNSSFRKPSKGDPLSEASSKERVPLPREGDGDQSTQDLDALRHIVVGPDQDRIAQLEQRLDDAELRAHELSQVLPDALVLSTSRDKRISRTLQPTIENSIRVSVQKNPKVLADAIFPLMGPGIRKAITATIMGMIQSFNQLLNHSFSIQGFKWRIEALRTRKPYAEIVLLHTLLYQVEQVFLIHRQTGLVLQHVVGSVAKFQDPDMVSGMLAAIEDFVRDSFNVASDQSLDTLRIGSDRSVWLEQGPKAMVAGVIRGTPPLELRHRMNEVLSDIHLKYGNLLDAFEGDTVAFDPAREDLQACLETEFKAAKKRVSPLFWIVSMLLLSALILGAFFLHRKSQRMEAFRQALANRSGIVITSLEKSDGRIVVSGLKDPLAEAPEPLLRPYTDPIGPVDYRWRPYVSLEPDMVLMRARQLLKPPPGATLELDGSTLVASGKAGHPWIQRFEDVAKTVAGIDRIRTDDLVDGDLLTLTTLRRRIENTRILFSLRSDRIADDQIPKLNLLVDDLQALVALSNPLRHAFGLRIIGYTDDSGTEMANLALSRERALSVRRFLIDKGKVAIAIMAVGMGAQLPAGGGVDKNIRAKSRFAGFELINDAGFKQGNDQ